MNDGFDDILTRFQDRLDAIEAWQKKITEAFDKNTNRLSERLQTLEQGTAEKLRRIDVRLHNSEAAQKPPERRWRRLWKFLAAAALIIALAVSGAFLASKFHFVPKGQVNEAICQKIGGDIAQAQDGRFYCSFYLD